MRVLPSKTSVRGVNCIHVYRIGFVATHHTNQVAVKTDVTPVGFDSNLPALEATSPHIGKPTAVNRAFLNDL